ncbi:GTPase, G3E family [Pseudomonas delhiensis]|uniref:GTPase, G3E family n=1 Tax=Pseudomonas delhiensis TaxID=366289 RepID=A0A239L9P4_9PSED|nr:CobW family GTP-binding protein [Pseudomonas delhiensis]SDJ80822.1 GTPase, G3E family [Pseudomonas delhiensis]SNT27336.1 GTPase, G3E family [Pseudomonas delhiensis]
MLEQIPTHVIGGPLGAGKTSLIRDLLAQRPAGERWAVLVNEFGQVGLDAALLATDADGVAIGEVAGGCLCCVNGAPFQVGLARLLRKARPQRLFIEPSGLGHPRTLLRQLGEAPWRGVLAPQPLLLVLDAAALAAGASLPEAQRDALADAALLVLNKSEGLDEAARERLQADLPALPQVWTEQGRLPFARLPFVANIGSDAAAELPAPMAELPVLLTRAAPLRQVHSEGGRQAVGWRLHADWRFRRAAVEAWLAGLGGLLRAKAVLHCEDGWQACNRLTGAEPWQPSAWRRDNRLELIFDAEQDLQALQQQMLTCARLADGQ